MKKTDLALLLFSFFVSAQGSFFGSTQSFDENLHVEEVEFASHGATLSGSIVFPVNQPIHAAVVLIHGSGKQTRNMALAERYSKQIIMSLVYDMRVARKSGGEDEGEQSVSEKNVTLLADDAISAVK